MEDPRRSRVQKSKQQSGPPVIKLRSSCDYCTDSKVRCDKQHPSCGRCIKLGRKCQYSISLRTARLATTLLAAGENHKKGYGDDNNNNEDTRSQRKRTTPPAATSGARGSVPPSSPSSASPTDHPNPGMFSSPPPAAEPSDGSETILTDVPGCITPFCFESMLADPKGVYVTENGRGLEDDDFLLNHLSGVSSHPPPINGPAGLQLPCSDVSTTAHEFASLWAWPDLGDHQPTIMMMPGGLSSRNDAQFNYNTYRESDEYGDIPPSMVKSKPVDGLSSALSKDNNIMIHESNESSIGMAATPLPHNCTGAGKHLLASVNRLSMRDENSPGGLTTGQALLVCSGITKRLQKLLECSCKGDPHLPFLVSVIISNVLITYSSIAQISTPPFCRGRSVTFRPVPLKLGVYEVDDEAGRLLNAQLVVHELRKMKQLETQFLEKYCRHVEAGEGDIYSALGNFIGKRLNQTIEACSRQGLHYD